MVRAKDFLNKKKAKAMSEQAALLPYEYRALLLEKHKKTGSFGYGVLNFFFLGIGSLVQGDMYGVLIIYGGVIGGVVINVMGVSAYNAPLATIGSLTASGFIIWNWFRSGMYESHYNKSLRRRFGSVLLPTPIS